MQLLNYAIFNPQHACTVMITVLGLCVFVCLCLMPYFSDTVSLYIHVYVEMKVPTALVLHRADFYKKGFSYKRFF